MENIQQTGKIDRAWGFEIVWASNDKYCGKILVFDKVGKKTAMTLHKEKCKSWFVNGGKFRITYIDTKTGETKSNELSEGMTFEAGPIAPYQIECLQDESILFEVSTPDVVTDNFKMSDDETQIEVQEQDHSS